MLGANHPVYKRQRVRVIMIKPFLAAFEDLRTV